MKAKLHCLAGFQLNRPDLREEIVIHTSDLVASPGELNCELPVVVCFSSPYTALMNIVGLLNVFDLDEPIINWQSFGASHLPANCSVQRLTKQGADREKRQRHPHAEPPET